MYPPELRDGPIRLSPRYRLLVINWALQLLSVLKFLHSRGIMYYGSLPQWCFLSSDLSIKLSGFLDANFVDSYGHRGTAFRDDHYDDLTAKVDLADWAQFYFILMIGRGHNEEFAGDHGLRPSARILPTLSNEIPGAKVVQKCRDRELQSAEYAWSSFVADLQQRGYLVDGDSLKDFDPIAQGLSLEGVQAARDKPQYLRLR